MEKKHYFRFAAFHFGSIFSNTKIVATSEILNFDTFGFQKKFNPVPYLLFSNTTSVWIDQRIIRVMH